MRPDLGESRWTLYAQRMRTLLLVAALALPNPATPEGPFVDLSFDAACKEAKASDRIVMIDFYAVWCGPCKRLDKVTWKDPGVVEWLGANTVALKIDAEKQTKLASQFKVEAYPTIVFAKPDGTSMGSITGYVAPAAFMKKAADVVAGVKPSDRIREQLAKDSGNLGLHVKLAAELRKEGDYERALYSLQWNWEFNSTLEKGAGAASDWNALILEIEKLIRDYPEARKPFEKRRDDLQQKVMSLDVEQKETRDFMGLNRALSQPERTLEVYDALMKLPERPKILEYGDSLHSLFGAVIPRLLKAGRYAEVVAGIGDPDKFMDKQLADLKITTDAIPDNEMFRNIMRGQVMTKSGQLYQALIGTGEHDAAGSALAARMVEFDPSVHTWNRLIRIARKAKRKELRVKLREMALEALPKSVHRKVKKIR